MVSKPGFLGAALSLLAVSRSGDAIAASISLPYKTYASASSCKITSFSSASANSVQAAETIAAKVSAALCDPGDSIADHATAAAEASAQAFASALVSATANCYASGSGSFTANGKSLASAAAVAIAEAYARAQASAAICGRCHVAGEAVAASFKEIFITATAGIEFVFNGIADRTEINAVYSVVSGSIQTATVTAFATAIADARVKYGECDGSAQADTGAGQPGDISSATSCKIDLNAASSEVVSNALVDIAGEAAAKVCGGGSAPASASADFEAEGTAVAKAMARAVTEISSSCYTKGKGYGCAAGKADIKKTATAVATIFAEGFSEATSECYKGCLAEGQSLSRVSANILATATSKTMVDQCTGLKPYFTLEKLELVIATAAAKAIAKAIATSSANSFSGCDAMSITEAGIRPTTPTTTKIPGGNLKVPSRYPPHATLTTPPVEGFYFIPSHSGPASRGRGHSAPAHVSPGYPEMIFPSYPSPSYHYPSFHRDAPAGSPRYSSGEVITPHATTTATASGKRARGPMKRVRSHGRGRRNGAKGGNKGWTRAQNGQKWIRKMGGKGRRGRGRKGGRVATRRFQAQVPRKATTPTHSSVERSGRTS